MLVLSHWRRGAGCFQRWQLVGTGAQHATGNRALTNGMMMLGGIQTGSGGNLEDGIMTMGIVMGKDGTVGIAGRDKKI